MSACGPWHLPRSLLIGHCCQRAAHRRCARNVVPAEWRYEVVEAVAYRAERGLVVPAVNRDRTGRVLDRGCGLGERHHLPALQQPNQAGLVVAGQASVARVWLGRRLVEAEQVLCFPAKRLRLVAPAGEERAGIVDSELPAVDRDEVRAASLESGHDPAVAGRKIGESRTVRTVKTAKTLICGCALSDINRRAMFCQFWQCFDCCILRF